MGISSTGEHILEMLKKEVLTEDAITNNLMGICSDGAYNLRENGPDSLVSLMKTKYPHIWSWHNFFPLS